MDSKTIQNKEHFKALICKNCKLCNSTIHRGQWCWPKFVENRSAFLSKFIHTIVCARGRGQSMADFRQKHQFKGLFCHPDTGACIMAFDCQGGMKECFEGYYDQVVGVPYSHREDGWGCGYPYVMGDEDAFNEHVLSVKKQQERNQRTTVIKRDKSPFIFTSTGKRFLNKVEKILEDRHKSKRRSRKSSTKTNSSAKRKANTSKSSVSRSTKGRKKAVGNSKAD